jgi:hypothetical protein
MQRHTLRRPRCKLTIAPGEDAKAKILILSEFGFKSPFAGLEKGHCTPPEFGAAEDCAMTNLRLRC